MISLGRLPTVSMRTHCAGLAHLSARPVAIRTSAAGGPYRYQHNNRVDVTAHPHSNGEVIARPFEEVPGPTGLPIIGTLWDYIKKDGLKINKLFQIMEERAREFGPIYREKIMHFESVVISDPLEYSKVMMQESRTPLRLPLEPVAHYKRTRKIPIGIVNAQGDEWYRIRTILNKKMMKPKSVQDYCGAVSDVADDFLRHLDSIRCSNGVVNNLENALFKYSLEAIGTVLFDDRIGCFSTPPPPNAEQFLSHLNGFFKDILTLLYGLPVYKIFPNPTWNAFVYHADNITEMGSLLVKKKLERMSGAKSVPTDDADKLSVLEYLLSQPHLTMKDVMSTVVDLMTGAVETVSNSAIFTLYCLSQSPEAQDALYRETKELFSDNHVVTPSHINSMLYMKACLKEMFRLYPITVTNSRFTHVDMEIAGYMIPKGTHIQANLYGMGRNESFFPEPEVYRPERWLRNNSLRDNSQLTNQSFASSPFGHGPRMCIGRRFAEQELYILLSKLVEKYHIEYVGEPFEPVLHTVMVPDRPVAFKFVPRG